MKRIIIAERNYLERTGFRRYPYKQVYEFIVRYGISETDFNKIMDEKNARLRNKFHIILNTRKEKELDDFKKNIGNASSRSKELKYLISKVKDEEQK